MRLWLSGVRVGVVWGLVVVAMVAAVLGAATSVAVAQEGAPYSDVPPDTYYAEPVSTLAAAGVFVGTECDEGFCPGDDIDRATVAVWTVRILDGADPWPAASQRFGDVDAAHPHVAFIERLAALGVTKGCGDGSVFCPDRTTTRAEMAAFLSRAFGLDEGPDPGFSDVPSDAWYAASVAKLAASGITKGCEDTMFCPDQPVTRAEMATFLARALELEPSEESSGSDDSIGGGGSGSGGGGGGGGGGGSREAAGLLAVPTGLNVGEAGTGEFSVRLATAPSADVLVVVSSGDNGALRVSSGALLVFTPATWATAQTVTVAGVDDDNADDDNVTVTAVASSTDAAYDETRVELEVNVEDDDHSGLVVDPTQMRVGEAGTGEFSLRLATAPSADVLVVVSSGDNGALRVSSGALLVFTPATWATAQTVTVAGVDDDNADDDNVTVTAVASSTDAAYDETRVELEVNVEDDDHSGLVVDPTQMRVGEAGTGEFSLRLATAPSADVLVVVSSGDNGALRVSSGALLVFTPATWATAQTVTVAGVDDDDDAFETVSVTATATSADANYAGLSAQVSATVADDDAAGPVGALDLGDMTTQGALSLVWHDWLSSGSNYFKFTLTRERFVAAVLLDISRDADVFLEQPQSDSTLAVLASSTNESNVEEYVNAVVPSGIYYVRVQSPGTHSLKSMFLMASTSPQANDPVPDFSTSASVEVGSCFGDPTRARIDPSWDIDWIRVELIAGETYVLEVRGLGSGTATLPDPELLGIYVNPDDTALHGAYETAGRLHSKGGGRIHDSHDLDSGPGNDARLEFTAAGTGSHYVKIDSQGGFAGTYVLAVSQEDSTPAQCQ